MPYASREWHDTAHTGYPLPVDRFLQQVRETPHGTHAYVALLGLETPDTSELHARVQEGLSWETFERLQEVLDLPAYVVIPVTFDSDLTVDLPARDLPDEWRRYPPPLATQRIGDAWAVDRQSVVLRVPSALVPEESNYLLKPGHPDFRHIRVGEAMPLVLDPRLLG